LQIYHLSALHIHALVLPAVDRFGSLEFGSLLPLLLREAGFAPTSRQPAVALQINDSSHKNTEVPIIEHI
jgi:hypothetical protein